MSKPIIRYLRFHSPTPTSMPQANRDGALAVAAICEDAQLAQLLLVDMRRWDRNDGASLRDVLGVLVPAAHRRLVAGFGIPMADTLIVAILTLYFLANMPTIKRLEAEVPNVLMDASGEAVGLPVGQQGASEPGHLTIGAGRVVYQDFTRVTKAIRDGEFFSNAAITRARQAVRSASAAPSVSCPHSSPSIRRADSR